MTRVAVVTCSRSDYSSCAPVLRAIQAEPDFELCLIAGGMHLAPEFGLSVREIEADGFRIDERIDFLLSSDTAEGAARSMGQATLGFAEVFAKRQPDVMLLAGDRLELLSAASAALPFRLAVAHVSGGDVTEGAIDNQVRHAVTKLSHIHFVAMQEHAERLVRMGEEPWRVFVTGDPALDMIGRLRCMSREELSASLGLPLPPPILLVTYHPTTLAPGSSEDEIGQLLAALNETPGTLIFTASNADPGGRAVMGHIRRFARSRPAAHIFDNLGALRYYSLLACADLMLGNSSSGIWEAPSFSLPVVNVGDRQLGRLRARNVIDVRPDESEIRQAIHRVLDPSFRDTLKDMSNPYGDGHAAARIVRALKELVHDPRLERKRFCSLPELAKPV